VNSTVVFGVTNKKAPFSVRKRRSSHLPFPTAPIRQVSENLLIMFKAARLSGKKSCVASKLTN